MSDSRPIRPTFAGLTIGLLGLIAAACSSPSGEVCEGPSDCEPGYECVSTGGVAFGDKLCLLAERAAAGADVDLDAAADTSTDTSDVADASVDARDDTHVDTGADTGVDSCSGVGCHVDSDGDGVVDAEDGCPSRPNPHQRDRDGDGVQDACDPELSAVHADAIFAGPEQGCCGGVFPWQVTGGDVTGDGRDDLVITGHGDDTFSLWVIDGATRPVGQVDLSTAIATLSVAQEGSWGLRVGRLGDVNGDGIDDIVVGHPGANNAAGRAFLFLGGALLQGNLAVRGADTEYFDAEGSVGFSVDIAPDLNGDGIDDIVVGETYGGAAALEGRVHIIHGSAAPPSSLQLAPTHGADVRFLGERNEQIGWSVAGVGDVNGDGLGDLVVGAPRATADSGLAYLVFGDSTWTSQSRQMEDVAIALTPQDTRSPGLLGTSVSRAGDVDGDGRADFLVGEPAAVGEAGMGMSGAAYLVFGRDNWPFDGDGDGATMAIAGVALRLGGVEANDGVGSAVSPAGDMDADGLSDFLIGAPKVDLPSGSASDAGAAYLVYGSTQLASMQGQSRAVDADARTYLGRNDGSHFGASLSVPGDVDGDAQLDLLVSSAGGDAALDANGAAFLFYGK